MLFASKGIFGLIVQEQGMSDICLILFFFPKMIIPRNFSFLEHALQLKTKREKVNVFMLLSISIKVWFLSFAIFSALFFISETDIIAFLEEL